MLKLASSDDATNVRDVATSWLERNHKLYECKCGVLTPDCIGHARRDDGFPDKIEDPTTLSRIVALLKPST